MSWLDGSQFYVKIYHKCSETALSCLLIQHTVMMMTLTWNTADVFDTDAILFFKMPTLSEDDSTMPCLGCTQRINLVDLDRHHVTCVQSASLAIWWSSQYVFSQIL